MGSVCLKKRHKEVDDDDGDGHNSNGHLMVSGYL